MVREKVLKPVSNGIYFRWRNHELYRIEAFSDAVFAFAVTLVVVSLEVPVTFAQLLQSMYGMIGFAICFMFLILIWHQQYLYFRHFGLRDRISIALNALLLFMVLFYVYPLKFLFTLLTAGNTVIENGEVIKRITGYDQLKQLMAIYSIGLIAVYLTFMLMYLHAARLNAQLKFNAIEKFNLRTQVYKNIVIMCFGFACLLALVILPEENAFSTGMIFIFIYPALFVFFRFRSKKMAKLFTKEDLQSHVEAVERSRHNPASLH